MSKKELYLIALTAGLLLTGCSDTSSNEPEEQTAKERQLSQALEAYVDHTVLPTYKGMADAAIELMELCDVMKEKHAAGTLTTPDIEAAGKAWKESRRNWELSEAFLFGPAAIRNIDPHIDSWPLDKTAMDILLADIRSGRNWSLENNGGYGLIGFHAVEYLLFELSDDENRSLVHSPNYTPEELEYLCAVAEDLCQQTVLLEACWAGLDNVSERKQQILEDAEIDCSEEYGREMKETGKPGSRFKTCQEAAEELVQGCIDIADEVGHTKIGRPHLGVSEEDKNYIESPYSLNSIEDFADNIRSIRNAYCGSRNGDPSVSDYVKSVNKDLDDRVRDAIERSITDIEAIPEPFAKYAGGQEAAKAVETVGTDLVGALEEVHVLISRN